MMKRTLRFPDLGNLAQFARDYDNTYLINTCNLTLTGPLSDEQVIVAKTLFCARVVASTERVFSYDPIPEPQLQLVRSI